MLIVLLLLLAVVAAAALALLWLVVRGHNKRLLLAGSHAVASGTPDGIGISVLCSGVRAQEQVENLLSAEYAHYEVIVVLDSLRYPVEFAAFTARYRMIRVEYVLSEELPVTGVRALGRSRKRRFRRLVLVDRAQDTPAGDFDAAAEVAAYDYVLPVREGQFLLPDAIARLVAEVGERGVGGCDCVRPSLSVPHSLAWPVHLSPAPCRILPAVHSRETLLFRRFPQSIHPLQTPFPRSAKMPHFTGILFLHNNRALDR